MDASDHRQIRKAQRAATIRDEARRLVILGLMSSLAGRAYVHDRLVRTHVFATSFSADPYRTAFAEGERNVGLQELNDLMRYCPDQYVAMMREATEKELTDGRLANSGPSRDSPDSNGRYSAGGAGAISDYDPGAGDDAVDGGEAGREA